MTTRNILIVILSLFSQYVAVAKDVRSVINFNREWKYMQGDFPQAKWKEYDDLCWQSIGIPHSFSIPYFMSPDFYTGYGWYRKIFSLSDRDLNKSLYLEFDGVFQEAEVFVNGTKVGSHRGGYTGFSIDFTKAAVRGENLVAVRVNNIWQATLAPRGGEHVFSGGIYRNVRLVIKDKAHIDWCGTTVTTPSLKKNKGNSSCVLVRSDVCNDDIRSASLKLVCRVVDKTGDVVAISEKRIEVPSLTKFTVEQKTSEIMNPRLWSVDSPELYILVSELYKGKKLVDKKSTKFGFRWMEWRADTGFFLNGKHLFFHGANVHQDQAGWGDAVTDEAARRDVRMIKEAGFDMIRGSHYPHSPAFVEACDEQGVMFWSEAPFWGTAGEKSDGYWTASAYPIDEKDFNGFENSALEQLEEMIKIHRNSPSVMAWSMCNEPFFSTSQALTGVKRLLTRMVKRTHELDITRPAAIGGAQRPLGSNRIDMIGDVAGYNGDGSTIIDFQNPGIPNVVSEYGSVTSDRPGEYAAGWGDLNKEDGWKGREWRCGQAIWCGFDHGSLFGTDMGRMGIVDYFRIPKRAWYWYRNEYRHIAPPVWPVDGIAYKLKLEATKVDNILADGTDDVQLIATILDVEGRELTVTPDVTLKVVSGPGEFPTGRVITFRKDNDISIQDGKAAIAIRSYFSGKCIVEASAQGVESARLELFFIGAPEYRDGILPIVKERRYTPYKREKTSDSNYFGLNNPTFASSAADGKSSGYACDGKDDTYWQPSLDDSEAVWTLDMERWPVINQIEIKFAQSGKYRYVLELSPDNKQWSTVQDLSGNNSTFDKQIVKVQMSGKYRFVRLRFISSDESLVPQISNVEVNGKLEKN